MDDNALTTLPNIDSHAAQQLAAKGLRSLPQLLHSMQQQQQAVQPQQRQQGGSQAVLTRDAVSGMLAAVLGGAGKASEVLAVAERLPILDVRWQPHRVQQQQRAAAAESAAAESAHGTQQGDSSSEAGKWVLDVQLTRRKPSGPPAGSSSSSRGGGGAPRVYAPLFPKVKEEGWWLVVGHVESLELLAMKRVSFSGKSSVKLSFPPFTASGSELHTVTLFFLSDCYLGLDQQYSVVLSQQAAAAEAQATAAAAARASWLGGGSNGPAAAADGAGDGLGSSGSVDAASRRARRQQQMAARQQHQAAGDNAEAGIAAAARVGGDNSWGDHAQGDDHVWEDEPGCG